MTVRGKDTGKHNAPSRHTSSYALYRQTHQRFSHPLPLLEAGGYFFFSCGSLRPSQLRNHLAGVLRPHFQHGNNTPSKLSKHTFFPKQIRRISSLYRAVYEGMKPWHTDTYRYVFFVICSRFKKKP